MVYSFFRYFAYYIIHAKTRQRLLFIAVVGLFISSFSLLVIQSIMGGLQKNLIARSKYIYGGHIIESKQLVDSRELEAVLQKHNISYLPELQLELLMRHKNFVSPVVAHGIPRDHQLPPFLEDKDLTGIVAGADLGTQLRHDFWSQVELISPVHTDSFIGDVPRLISEHMSDFILTDLAEIDRYHLWVRNSLLYNLIREEGYNRFRLFTDDLPKEFINDLNPLLQEGELRLRSWEDYNQPLVWALRLEKLMMIFLFSGMSLLVAISITSGFLIFFQKIRIDLMSFWILGMDKKQLLKLAMRFTFFLNASSCLLGIVLAILFLFVLDRYAPNMMPDVFVERRLPVNITVRGLLISYFIPFSISSLFSFLSYQAFKKDNQTFLHLLRRVV